MNEIEIINQALVKFPKAKRIAVENATMGQTDGMAFRMNLEADRQAYSWNSHTMAAINFVMKNKRNK